MTAVELTAQQRIQSAKLIGATDRFSTGMAKDAPRDEAVAYLRSISTDRTALGSALGVFLYRLQEGAWYQPAVDLLRTAGADEDVAQAVLADMRERVARRGHL